MTSLSNTDTGQSTCRTERTSGHDSSRNTNTPLFRFAPDQKCVLTRPATRSISKQHSKGSNETIPGGFQDGSVADNASSVTLQVESPWHEVGVNKHAPEIPYTIAPVLLQGIHDIYPSRSSLDGTKGCGPDGDSSELGDRPRYCSAQKGKWKHEIAGNVGPWIRSPSPEFHLKTTYISDTDWVVHNRPILQDYANRQVSLPLGRRLEISIDEPSDFILGSLQLLVNRDRRDYTDRTRQLGPQLIENFVNIDRWAKEYFRSRHGTQDVDSDVSTLLTIVMNNFYEGQVQLIDRLVDFALENMHVCRRNSLRVEDFAFGFDFRMSQDLPFYVETSSQIREPLPIRVAEARSTPEPVTTQSGRQVKPTKRAQQASEHVQTTSSGGRHKAKNPKMKDKKVRKGSTPPARQKKNLAQLRLSPDHTVQETSKTTCEHMKHRPNLRQPPISPGSLSIINNASQLKTSSSAKSNSKASVGGPQVSDISGPSSAAPLKFVLPRLESLGSKASVATSSGSTSSDTNRLPPQINAPVNASEASDRFIGHSGGTRTRSSRNRRERTGKQKRGSMLSAKIPEVAPDSIQAEQLLDDKNTGTSAIINSPVAFLTLTDGLRNAGDSEQPHVADTGTRENSSTYQSIHGTDQHKPPLSDPDHPRKKKRKINDRED